MEVQRGQAIALLMQGQRQQQVALQFGVNVSTIERLVRRLRDTGRVADLPRRGRPHVNASVGEAFPMTSVVRMKKSEPRLICEKNLSPLPHWKLSGTMCRQSSHATRATCTSERKTNVRSTSPQTKLVQSVSHSFWANVVITQVSKMNSPVVSVH
jgi:hypothetical protein